jgi:hypothetical protein
VADDVLRWPTRVAVVLALAGLGWIGVAVLVWIVGLIAA